MSAGAGAVAEGGAEYRRVHRLTPLLRFWTLILAVFAGLVFNVNASTWGVLWGLISGDRDIAVWPVLLGLGVTALVAVALWLLSGIWWRATGFRLTAEELQYRRGVLNTQLRTARFDRIQAVDLVESVIARIFRVATVRVETAGGGDSAIDITYLRRDEAVDLRRELVDATRRHPVASAGGDPAGADTPDAGPGTGRHTLVPEIPIRQTLASSALSPGAILAVLGVLIVLLTPLGPVAAVPLLIGLLPPVWNLVDRSWKFTAVLGDDVLHVNYGLADRRRQAIPVERIHGVSLTQPLLWRFFGWWTVSVTVVGYGDDTKDGGTSKILPVGSRELALRVLAAVGPLSETEIDVHADPAGLTTPTYRPPPEARWVTPIDRSRQGVTLIGAGPRAVIVHSGRLVPRMSVIATSHIQELTLRRGPVQRVLGLATVSLDLVPGPVSMSGDDLRYAEGMELLSVLRRRRLPELRVPRNGVPDLD